MLNSAWSEGPLAMLGGIGLNVSNKEPTTCLEAIFSEASNGAHEAPIVCEGLLAQICFRLENLLQVSEKDLLTVS